MIRITCLMGVAVSRLSASGAAACTPVVARASGVHRAHQARVRRSLSYNGFMGFPPFGEREAEDRRRRRRRGRAPMDATLRPLQDIDRWMTRVCFLIAIEPMSGDKLIRRGFSLGARCKRVMRSEMCCAELMVRVGESGIGRREVSREFTHLRLRTAGA